MITREYLQNVMPNAKYERIFLLLPALLEGCEKYQINTPKRENQFIAQLAHESGEFRYLEELASGKAYEGRKDLGNTQPGDGVRFKGRGLIQITGRANYQSLSKDLGFDFITHPTELELPFYAAMSACWFWNSRGLNAIADIGDFIRITKRINGGTNGIVQRQMYLDRANKYNPI